MSLKIRKLSFENWMHEIALHFIAAGFKEKIAFEKSKNYVGLWIDEFHYFDPKAVVENAMKREGNLADIVCQNALHEKAKPRKRKLKKKEAAESESAETM